MTATASGLHGWLATASKIFGGLWLTTNMASGAANGGYHATGSV